MTTRNVLVFGLISFFLYACKKSDNGCTTVAGSPTATEVTNLRNYLTGKSITATEDPRGFFYNIVFPGTGSGNPTVSDSVTIKYRGTLTDGSVFDSTANGETRKFLLSDLITGWQLGLPLLKKSGIIDLYLPPAHGFGCYSQGKLPANATTIFRIELQDF